MGVNGPERPGKEVRAHINKFLEMVRSGERPGSAPADWLASQNDSFTVALDHCVPFYCPFYNKAADDADIALLTILQHATTVAISLQRSSRPRCGPRCGPHLKDNHDVVRHTKQRNKTLPKRLLTLQAAGSRFERASSSPPPAGRADRWCRPWTSPSPPHLAAALKAPPTSPTSPISQASASLALCIRGAAIH